MKTDDLISLLATGAGAVPSHCARRRYATAIGAGSLAATALLLSLLRLRADLADAVMLPTFWLKIGFVVSLVLASLFAALRLSRPGARLDWLPAVLAAPLLVIWAIAAYSLIEADPAQRWVLFLGATWRVCPLLIALISLPLLAAVMWAMRGLAPTRPLLAGFAAGLLAGAVAALVYCLHCPETAVPFIAFWYVLGMLVPALVGALLGRLMLRW